MARNGSGVYNLVTNSWNPATNGVSATAADWQNLINDVAAALTQSLSADGQTPVTGNINMGGNKFTNLSTGNGTGQSVAWQQLFSQGVEADIASASTVDIGAQNTNFLRITGTTTITSFGTNYNGPRFIRFGDSLTLTHNATTLILPTAANIVTVAGDRAIVTPIGSPGAGWQVIAYQRADGKALLGSDTLNTTRIDVASASTVDLTTSAPNTRHINITGTTTINGFTVAAGQCYFVRFAGVTTLTNNANIDTQTGADITTKVGATCILRATAANTVEVFSYVGEPLLAFASSSENSAGAVENKAVDPLGIREAFNATGSAPVYACRAFVNFDATSNSNISGTYSQSGTFISVAATAHNLKAGHRVYLTFSSGTALAELCTVASVTDANNFVATSGTSRTTSGNCTLNFRFIRAAGNVSRVVDCGVAGDSVVNFTEAMQDTGYSVGGSAQRNGTDSGASNPATFALWGSSNYSDTFNVAWVRIRTKPNTVDENPKTVCVHIFR